MSNALSSPQPSGSARAKSDASSGATSPTPPVGREGGPAAAESNSEIDARREFVQGLQRGFAVVKAFSADARHLTVAEVAARTALTRAVARRYLLTLQEMGYVVQHAGRFTLTPRILDLGFTYLSTIDIPNVALPVMTELADTLRESCSVAVLEGADCVYVARVPAKRIMSINLVVGSRLPAHATSMGKILLAHLSPVMLDEYFATTQRQHLTSRTITDEPALRKALHQVRERGWASADQESEDGVRTVAVPLHDVGMQVQAAMNVSGHASRVSMKELRTRYLPLLQEAGIKISRALGAKL